MANLSLSDLPSLSELGKRFKAKISNLVGSRKGEEPIVLTISPPESEEDSPVSTPSLTEIRGPMTSTPVERGLPVLSQVAVSPISQLFGLSFCESDCPDGSDGSESDSD